MTGAKDSQPDEDTNITLAHAGDLRTIPRRAEHGFATAPQETSKRQKVSHSTTTGGVASPPSAFSRHGSRNEHEERETIQDPKFYKRSTPLREEASPRGEEPALRFSADQAPLRSPPPRATRHFPGARSSMADRRPGPCDLWYAMPAAPPE